jgi:hypothetical protein
MNHSPRWEAVPTKIIIFRSRKMGGNQKTTQSERPPSRMGMQDQTYSGSDILAGELLLCHQRRPD